jgi:hypothetical protein
MEAIACGTFGRAITAAAGAATDCVAVAGVLTTATAGSGAAAVVSTSVAAAGCET